MKSLEVAASAFTRASKRGAAGGALWLVAFGWCAADSARAQAGCAAPSFFIQVRSNQFRPSSVAPVVADFTGDGILDLVVANEAFVPPDAVLTLIPGLTPVGPVPEWDAPRDFPILERVGRAFAADVDSDGWLDAIVWHFRLSSQIGGPTLNLVSRA